MDEETRLAVIRLVNPVRCFRCRFSDIALVERSDGTLEHMILCARLDCDNWDTSAILDTPNWMRTPGTGGEAD